ncbi:MAG: serine hydrolase [Ignavibacteriales bacterium]|nr:serine hydrolase [Ignavibacteriales bacterium]
MTRRIFFVAAAVLMSLSQGIAQSPNLGLNRYFSTYMSANHIPGVAAAILKGNTVLWQGYYGVSNNITETSVTQNTVFNVASLSKSMIVTSIMQLREKGMISLDDSLERYLPFNVRNPNFPGVPITIRMLLNHTSSIEDNLLNMPMAMGDFKTPLGEYLNSYLKPGGLYYDAKKNFSTSRPGTNWSYSNISPPLAAYIVERVSGKSFDQYCADNIFTPLGMSSASWFLSQTDTLLIARPYSFVSSVYLDRGLYGFPNYPAGSLRITLPDFQKFLFAYINGGAYSGVRILKDSSIGIMRTSPVYLAATAEWGLTWYRLKLNSRWMWGLVGGNMGVIASMFMTEQDSIGVLFMENGDGDPTGGAGVLSQLQTSALSMINGFGEPHGNLPSSIELGQNYPNPFNPATTIEYAVPQQSHVTLKIFDLLGREVAVMVNERKDAGTYSVQWNAAAMPSGIYFYRLQAESFTETKRLMLLK